jgi:hypothetical protein
MSVLQLVLLYKHYIPAIFYKTVEKITIRDVRSVYMLDENSLVLQFDMI